MGRRRNTTQDIIKRFKEVHGDKFDYSQVKYQTFRTKVKIICSEGHIFEQTPRDHIAGCGCKICCVESRKLSSELKKKRVYKPEVKSKIISKYGNLSSETFILKAREIHGEFYDYSKSIYINSKEKLIITCPLHGDFLQSPSKHITRQQGCPDCGYSKKGASLLSVEELKKKARAIHGDKYDYSLLIPQPLNSKFKFICREHGVFEQTFESHLNSKECCSTCRYRKLSESFCFTQEEFLKKALEVHGDKYDYSNTIYVSMDDQIKVYCKTCDKTFSQKTNNHVNNKYGCPLCALGFNKSKPELDLLEWVETTFSLECVSGYRPSWLIPRGYKKPCEIDIYIPSIKLGIEYNGSHTHHSSTVGIDFLDDRGKPSTYHLDKYELCRERGITLIHVFDFEDLERWKEFIYSYIKDPSSFEISFENTERVRKGLTYYGKNLF